MNTNVAGVFFFSLSAVSLQDFLLCLQVAENQLIFLGDKKEKNELQTEAVMWVLSESGTRLAATKNHYFWRSN